MNTQQREVFKQALESSIQEARQAVARQTDANRSIAPDNAIGRISRMDTMYHQQVNEETLKRAKERLAKLEYIIGKIDDPDFALCEYCRQPIQLKRLLAIPESTVCIRCAAFSH